MNLDNYQQFSKLDKSEMIAEINGLPNQLFQAYSMGLNLPLNPKSDIRKVLITGMGGSAIGADLLSGYLEPIGQVPVIVQRDYNLPAWANNPDTLLVVSSHSGNTEEPLSVLGQALKAECQIVGISTGGRLKEVCDSNQIQCWIFNHQGQPRAAVGYSFGLLLALLVRLGLAPDAGQELNEALAVMDETQTYLRVDVPVAKNPAKRLAGQLVGRWVTVMGPGILAPVARRWKGQISELAKAWAQFEALPEADHNTLAGTDNPEGVLMNTFVIFLQGECDHPRNKLRAELTRQALMCAGIGTDAVYARGESRLAQLWSTLLLGDYCAYYLAMAYGVDPTPIPAITALKQAMQT